MLQLSSRAKHLLSEIVREFVRAHLAERCFRRARVAAHSLGEPTRVSIHSSDDAPDWDRSEFPCQFRVKASLTPEASKAGNQSVALGVVMVLAGVPATGVPAQ